jgi:hypothetical protein
MKYFYDEIMSSSHDPYKEHIITIVFVVLGALSVGNFDEYVNNYWDIWHFAIILFIFGTIYAITVNKELLLKYGYNLRKKSNPNVSQDFSGGKIPKFKFGLFSIVDLLLILFCVVVVINLLAIDNLLYKFEQKIIYWQTPKELEELNNIIRWIFYCLVVVVILMIRTYPLYKSLESQAKFQNLYIGVYPKEIHINPDVRIGISIFLKNMNSEEGIWVENVTIEAPEDIKLYYDDDYTDCGNEVSIDIQKELAPEERLPIELDMEYHPTRRHADVLYGGLIITVKGKDNNIIATKEVVVKMVSNSA